MLTLTAVILTAIIATLLTRKMNQHRITDLKNSHNDELRKEQSKWFSAGFSDGRRFAAKECALMKAIMSTEDFKKQYGCTHN